jgi:hypothetical protein
VKKRGSKIGFWKIEARKDHTECSQRLTEILEGWMENAECTITKAQRKKILQKEKIGNRVKFFKKTGLINYENC